jgi:hypothetical protein
MPDTIPSQLTENTNTSPAAKFAAGEKPVWETPVMEDVSEQVMAQPYIRFT